MNAPDEAPLRRRLWILLFAGVVIALAACLTGAAPCALMRPLAVVLTLAAAAASFLDAGSGAGGGPPPAA